MKLRNPLQLQNLRKIIFCRMHPYEVAAMAAVAVMAIFRQFRQF